MARKIEDAQEAADRARAEVLSARIRDALEKTEDNRSKAADLLGMAKRTFYRNLGRLGLTTWKVGQPVPKIPSQRRRKAA